MNALSKYQKWTDKTGTYPHHNTGEITYVLLGLISEVGELCEMIEGYADHINRNGELAGGPDGEFTQSVREDVESVVRIMRRLGVGAGKAKRRIRDEHPELFLPLCNARMPTETPGMEKLKSELGDILWYLARCATEIGVDLDDVAKTNVAKLESRLARGVICGKGGDR